MLLWTATRLAAVQRWPVVPNPPQTAPSTARSRLASSMTMMIFLPPISRLQCLKDGAQASAISRPTAVEPVKLITGTSSLAANDIHNTRRNPSLGKDLHEVIGGQRRILGGLQHHRVPADERGRHLPRRNGHRKIPGCDHSADANRLPHAHGEFIRQLRRSRLPE